MASTVSKATLVVVMCCFAALVPTARAASAAFAAPKRESELVRSEPAPTKSKAKVQDGILLDLHSDDEEEEPLNIIEHDDLFEIVPRIVLPESAVPSLVQLGAGRICEDVTSEHTGFDVHSETGFKSHASCEELTQYCHNSSIGEQVRVSCPVACFICVPGGSHDASHTGGPCFDAVNTGIRFRDGPKAECSDLINYCNHSSIGTQVQEACKLSCGLCDLHIEGPYLDAYGNCLDLQTHEEPQFTVSGSLAGCSDMAQFCNNHPDSYLIRHKCPLSCGVCGNNPASTPAPTDAQDLEIPGDAGGCDRRRRWGFCSTRRRRHV